MTTDDFLDELLGGWETSEAPSAPKPAPGPAPLPTTETAGVSLSRTSAPSGAAPKAALKTALFTPARAAAMPNVPARVAAAPARVAAAPKATARVVATPKAAAPKAAAPKATAPKATAPRDAAPRNAAPSDAASEAAAVGGIMLETEAPVTAAPLALQVPAGGSAIGQLGQLAPLRANDPLALGVPRAPPPPDPEPFDEAREEREFARSLLSEVERAQLREELRAEGFMPIDAVRTLIGQNSAKASRHAEGEACLLDPEVIILVDTRIDYKIFATSDNVYTRKELYAAYPFQEFGVPPEAIFAQQEIGVFPAKKYALDATELEYVARDVGDETVDFVMLEDLVGRAARPTHADGRRPLKVVKTKVYLGKERWDDFCQLHRMMRSIIRVGQVRQLGGSGGGGLLALLAGPKAGADAEPDPSSLRRREEELRRREAEQREREAEQRRREEEVNGRIAADLLRVEAMLRAAEASRNGRHPKPPAGTPPAGEEIDSVSLF